MTNHHAIYIPGIGDHKTYHQPEIINLWKRFGVTPHYHAVIWRGDEDFKLKLDKLTALVDQLHSEGRQVSIVGVSAGATAAFNTYMARRDKIHKVVYICGKLRNPQTVGPKYYKHNPAFMQSLNQVQPQIDKLRPADKAKMLSMQPFYDQIVPIADTHLPGVRNWRMLSVYHTPSIFMGITAYAPVVCSFIKKEKHE